MKTLRIDVLDDAKFQLVLDFLQEVRFIRISPSETAPTHVKRMTVVPPSILHPRHAPNFTPLTREELHER